jgi:hypothetical protein
MSPDIDDGVAARSRVDVQALLEELEVLVELPKQLAGEPIVLERQNKVIGVARDTWGGAVKKKPILVRSSGRAPWVKPRPLQSRQTGCWFRFL